MYMCIFLIPFISYGLNYIIYYSSEFYSYIIVGISILLILAYYYYDLTYYKNNSYLNRIDCVLCSSFILIVGFMSYSARIDPTFSIGSFLLPHAK